MFAPYGFKRCASTKDLCRLCLRAGVFLGHHSGGARRHRQPALLALIEHDVPHSALRLCLIVA